MRRRCLVAPQQYIRTFRWHHGKFDPSKGLPETAQHIMSETHQLDTLVKHTLHAFGQTKTALIALDKKQGCSLLVKSLAPILQAHAGVFRASEYMENVLVVVPV